MYDDILVPTDGSDATDAALDHALYVVDDTGVPMDVTTVTLQEALVEHGEAAVATVAERIEAADVPVVSEVRRGTPHRQILDYADEHDVDLVVMATHGRTGVDRYLLGSRRKPPPAVFEPTRNQRFLVTSRRKWCGSRTRPCSRCELTRKTRASSPATSQSSDSSIMTSICSW